MKKSLLTGIAALFLATGTAQHEAHALADGPACAMVRQTPDGFLNLRADFSMSGKIIAKLRPGDVLHVTSTELGISTLGGWVKVDGVWHKPGQAGWVARRFIREIKCPANDKLPEAMLGTWC
jgi:hypothetical protein